MKIRTEWNLGLLYKGDNDPKIEEDLKTIQNAYRAFEKKYRGKNFIKTPKILAKALSDFEKTLELTSGMKPWWYFALKTDLNSEDKKSGARATKYDHLITEASNKTKFFTLEIAKIPLSQHKRYLKDPVLRKYSYFLKKIFNRTKYYLTEGEEQLEDLLSQTSYTMWVDNQDRILHQQLVKHEGKNLPIVEVIGKLSEKSKKERRFLHVKINEVLKSISYVAEAELNAIYNYKRIMDERRGYKKSYSSTILGYENDEKSIESFISLISSSFKISHRFYKLHAKLLGEKKITLADRNSMIGKIKKKFDFNASVELINSMLKSVDVEYSKIFERYLEEGHFDVYPKKGKKGGAYCWGMGRLPTFVMLNHVNDIRSLQTIAHEMGHAVHGEMGRAQSILYKGHTPATGEVASTFFEQVMSDEIEKHLSNKEKIIYLHSKISEDVSSIFRQIACFNFQAEFYERVKKEGQVPKDGIADLMSKHLKSYVGPAVDVNHDDGYFYVYWSHIRDFFYVYTYAYGQIISRAMYEKWKEDPKYADKVKQFLKAGRSMSPEDIFKSIGIDTSKTSFFEAGLKGIERDIARLEKLTK